MQCGAFLKQTENLLYHTTSRFRVPEIIKIQVNFWRIYSKKYDDVSTQQM